MRWPRLPVPAQIGGVARAADECAVRYAPRRLSSGMRTPEGEHCSLQPHQARLRGLLPVMAGRVGKCRHTGELGVATLTAVVTASGIAACASDGTLPPSTSISSTNLQEMVMPNLVGKYWMDAERELRHQGWRGILEKGPDIPVQPQNPYRILRQTPSAGEHMKSGDRITVQFGN